MSFPLVRVPAAGLFVVALLGCARPVPSLEVTAVQHERGAAPTDAPPRFRCGARGSMRLERSDALFAGRDGADAFARFSGRFVALAIDEVPSLATDRLSVRASASGFSLDGWLDRRRLSFAAARRIPLADTAWIPRGTSLKLGVGVGRRVMVSPPTRKLEPIDALVDCEDVAIGAVDRDPDDDAAPYAGSPYELVGDRLAVSPKPGLPATFTLRQKPGQALLVYLAKQDGGLHLRFQDGVAVEGYVSEAEVKHLGSSWSVTCCGGIGVSYGVGVPGGGARVARARRATTITSGATAGGAARGSIARDAEVLVLDEHGGFARVLPRCHELAPEEGQSFWVARADLDVVSAMASFTTLLAGCR